MSRSPNRLLAFFVLALALAASCGRSLHASEHHGESEEHAAAPIEDGDPTKTRGIELGEYKIRAYYPVESQKSSIKFTLYATTTGDKSAHLRELVENRENKVRDQVIIATRLVPLADFDDPELKSFRRRILLQLRRSLPELTITDVYVSDFAFNVQRN